MKSKRIRLLLNVLIPTVIALVFSLLIINLESGDLIGGLELKSEDARFVSRGQEIPERDILIVAADYITQKTLGVWPLPLDYSTQIIANLKDAGASVVAFTGTEDNPDNETEASRDKIISELTAAMDPGRLKSRRTEVVLGGAMRNEAFMIDGAISGRLKQIVIPYTIASASGALVGISTKLPDPDSAVRREAIFFHDRDFERCYTSLSLATAFAKMRADGDTASLSDICFDFMNGNREALDRLPMSARGLPLEIEDDNAFYDINYYGPPGTFPSLPYMDVLLANLNPDILLKPTTGSGIEFSEGFHNLLEHRSTRIPDTVFGSSDASGLVSGAALYRRPGYPEKIIGVEPRAALLRTYIPSYSDPDPEMTEMDLKEIYSETLPGAPAAILVDPDKNIFFVLDALDGALSILDPVSAKIIDSVKLPGKNSARRNRPQKITDVSIRNARMVIDHAGDIIYATLDGLDAIARVNAGTLEVLPPINLGFQPVDMVAGGNAPFTLFVLDGKGIITGITPSGGVRVVFEQPLDSGSAGISKLAYIEVGMAARGLSEKEVKIKKLYAMDSEKNALHFYNAENGRYRGKLGMPGKFIAEVAELKKSLIQSGKAAAGVRDAEFTDLAATPGENRLYVTVIMPDPFFDGDVMKSMLLVADPYTDKWFSNEISIECPIMPGSLAGDDDTLFLTCENENSGFSFKALNNTIWEKKNRENVRKRVAGKIILVGPTVEVAGDTHATPFFEGRKTPGVEITANAVKNILDGAYISRPGGTAGRIIIIVLGFISAIITWYFARNSKFGAALACIVVMGAMWSGLCWLCFSGLTPGFLLRFLVAAEGALLFLAALPLIRKADIKSRYVNAIDFMMAKIAAPIALAAVVGAIAFRFLYRPGSGSATARKIYELLLSNTAMAILAIAFVGLLYGARIFLKHLSMRAPRKRASLGVAIAVLIAAFVSGFCIISISGAPRLLEIGINLGRPLVDNMMIPFVAPVFSIALCGIFSIVYFAFTESREKTEIKLLFSKYVNQALVDQLVADPKKLSLGGKLTEVTILFADIRNFSIISEKMEPETLVSMLNEFFSEMSSVIMRSGGTLDKFMGDCIMAFWGAPVEQHNHSIRAVLAMVEMQESLERLKEKWKAQGRHYPPLRIGIGLNTGSVIVGNIGSEIKMEYTVIGAPVNTTQRIEQSCKQYGAEMLISKSVYDEVKDMVEARPTGTIEVGRNLVPVHLYEVIRLTDEEKIKASIFM